jgi:hypothetical protein
MKKNTLTVVPRLDDDGVTTFLADGKEVAFKMPWAGTVADCRLQPPFVNMIPCPFCGTNNNAEHVAEKHVDHFLGESFPFVE